MLEVKMIKKYLKCSTSYFSKEQELLLKNKQIILSSLTKLTPLSLLRFKKIETPLSSFLRNKNYQVTKRDLKSFLPLYKKKEHLLEDTYFIFIKKLSMIIAEEEIKRTEYLLIQSILFKLDLDKSISINTYYDINRNLKPYSLFYFIKEIENRPNKTKLLEVLSLSLSLKGLTISSLLMEYETCVYQNIILIQHILKSLLSLQGKSSSFFHSIETFKKQSIHPTFPLHFNFLSNKNYTLFLDEAGQSFSQYKNILLYKQDTFSFSIQDKKSNAIYSLHSYDPACKYKNVFNEAIASYIKRYDEFIIKTEISISQEEDLELRVFSIKNTHYEPKSFTVNFNFSMQFLFNRDVQYGKMIQNSTYHSKLHSFITYHAKNHLYFVTKVFPFENLSFSIDKNNYVISVPLSLDSNEEKKFYLLNFISYTRSSIYSILQKYQTLSRQSEYLFFKSNLLKNSSSYKDFVLYHTFFNLIWQVDFKRDIEKEKQLFLQDISMHSLWKYQISGNYKILLIHIQENYTLKAIDEIFTFHSYLKNNGIYVDLLFLYPNEVAKKAILEFKRYFSLLNENYLTFDGVFLLSSLEIPSEEFQQLKLLSTLYIELKDNNHLQDIVSYLKRKQSRQKNLQNFIIFLEREKKIEAEKTFCPNIFEEEDESILVHEIRYLDRSSSTFKTLFLDNSYGGFDLVNNEYVIYHFAYPWKILLSNSYLYSIYSNKEQTSLCSSDSTIFTGFSDFYEILLNNQSITFQTIRVGFGYSTFSYNEDGVELIVTKFLSTIDPILFYKFDFQNKSNLPITIQLKFLLLPLLGLHAYEARFLSSFYDKKNNLVRIKNKLTGKQLFISATKKFKDIFCHSFLEKILEIEISFFKDERKSFSIFIGTNPRKDYFLESTNAIYDKNILLLKEKYANISVVENSLYLTKIHFKDLLHVLSIETDDTTLNLMCSWQTYEILLFNGYDRESLLQHHFLYTIQDLLYDSLSLLLISPDLSKKNILKCLEHVTYKGELLSSWNASENIGMVCSTLSTYLLLFYSIQKYLEVSEDYAILNGEYSYLLTRLGREKEAYFKSTTYHDSFYQHLEKILNFVLENEKFNSNIILYQILVFFVSITKIYNKNKDITFYREKLQSLEKDRMKKVLPNDDMIYKLIFNYSALDDEKDWIENLTCSNKLLKICVLAKLGQIDKAYHLYKNLSFLYQTATKKRIDQYKKEPYFSNQNSLYFFLFLELFLGVKKQGKRICISPTLPTCIKSFKLYYKYYSTIYEIYVFKNQKKDTIIIDGEEAIYISLKNDYKKHIVEIYYKEKNCL